MVSKKGLSLFRKMEKRYIDCGYIYDGCIIAPERDKFSLFLELVDNGLIERRNSEIESYCLTRDIRKRLIIQYRLVDKWKKKAEPFYPCSNELHGEFISVFGARYPLEDKHK